MSSEGKQDRVDVRPSICRTLENEIASSIVSLANNCGIGPNRLCIIASDNCSRLANRMTAMILLHKFNKCDSRDNQ